MAEHTEAEHDGTAGIGVTVRPRHVDELEEDRPDDVEPKGCEQQPHLRRPWCGPLAGEADREVPDEHPPQATPTKTVA